MTRLIDNADPAFAQSSASILPSVPTDQTPSDIMRAVPLALAISAVLWAIAIVTLLIQLHRG